MSNLTVKKVAELRALCKQKNLDVTGSRDDLLKRLGGEDEEPQIEEKKAAKKEAPKKKAAPKKASKKVEKEEEEEEEEEEKVEEVKTKKKAKAPKGAQEPSSKKAAKSSSRRVQTDRLVNLPNAKVYEGHGVMLNQTNIGNNNNKFYVIQLLDSNGTYYVWNRWGRVGENGQNAMKGPFSLDGAKKEFAKKFKEKTKNAWADDVRQTFQSHAGKYTLLDMAEDDEDDDKPVAKAVPKKTNASSSLDPLIQDFVRRIYAEATGNLRKNIDCEFTKKGIKTPLGVLSQAQVEKGDGILDEILQELEGKNRKSVLAELSSLYYTNIPHSHGRVKPPVIDSMILYKEKMDLSQLMKDMLLVVGEEADVLFEDDVDAKYHALGTQIRLVEKGKDEWNNLLAHVGQHYEHEDHANFKSDGDKFDPKRPCPSAGPEADELQERVKNIFAVSRPDEQKRFDSKIGNEHMMFHASRFQNFVGILSRGILLPEAVTKLGVKRTDFGWLGAGIYFGSEWTTSEGYCGAASDGTTGLMIVLKVALGKVQHTSVVDGSIKAPQKGFNSIHGDPDAPNSGFADHEYCIYRDDQSALQYLIEFDVY